ncbi:coproporphyrinogen III oxidase [Trichocoleus sp. FACHB-591]|uniref:radical SAM family heme chaperone HemW n=1 Tax=Trichocoleus sp. FACHB-591 TaxID=2692872 RepID=UPI0016862827|nr:radical SAM family heme chaperone HemW [Trichocoleus sp. FACHB-591]MBD2094138.1 coproporphyrinogen III oxidase [Trichocoleus sp. FACHB-591]
MTPILDRDRPKAAYLHIPFCRRRCYYCDFPVSVVGDQARGENSGAIAQYVEVLCQEIELAVELTVLEKAVPIQPLETIFFGGGTPSLLSVAQLDRILQTLEHKFGIAANAEISIEIDPGTFDLPQIQGYRAAGVDRVSLGVQAFQPELLALCGRTHSVVDIYAAVELIHQAQMVNFSLDLISGLPHQTLDQWQASIEAAIALAPKHLSCYDLIVEPVTAFGRQYQPGDQPLPSDTSAAEMYRLAQQLLSAAGYEHYEVSNYAQPGFQCRHNCVYWKNQPFYGFGMGAASYLQGQRFTRPRKTREYYEWVKAQKSNLSSSPPSASFQDLLLDTLMLGFRLAEGLSLVELAQQFGKPSLDKICHSLQSHYAQGWVEVGGVEWEAIAQLPLEALPPEARIRLSDPEGFLFSNQVLADLFADLE